MQRVLQVAVAICVLTVVSMPTVANTARITLGDGQEIMALGAIPTN